MTFRVPRIATSRLRLREFTEGDLDAMTAIVADPEVSRYVAIDGLPRNREHAWRMMTNHMGHWMLRGYGMWAVEEKAGGRLAGYVGPYYPESWPGPEIGWTIAREFWGRGFATEAARMALEYARDTLKWPKVMHIIHPDNWRSIAVAKRIGSAHVGAWERGDKLLHLYGQDLA